MDLKETLATMFPDKNKQEQAERRTQHTTNKPAARHKQNTTDELALLKAKMNEISTLFNVFLKHKERVAISPDVCFPDSAKANSKRSHTLKAIKYQYKQ